MGGKIQRMKAPARPKRILEYELLASAMAGWIGGAGRDGRTGISVRVQNKLECFFANVYPIELVQ